VFSTQRALRVNTLLTKSPAGINQLLLANAIGLKLNNRPLCASGVGVGHQARFVCSANSEIAGASPAAIQYHYDVGTDFFRTWLGEDLVYSGARWREPLADGPRATSLEEAQTNKLDFHLRNVRAGPGRTLLDIGFGWGALMHRAVATFDAKQVIGATLSVEQFRHVQARKLPRTRLHLESYETLTPGELVDGIVSVGALEHFAKPGLSREMKVAIYRNFFERCRSFSRPASRLSLQTIFWQSVERQRAGEIVPTGVFPESDLCYLDELLEGAQPHFRTIYLETSEDDYVLTLREWLSRLRRAKREKPHLVDEAKFLFHEDYLRRCIVGFGRRRISLARIVLERL
jgi:cyclopropane-fatty-acyl-phospholipid synthase